MIERVPFSPHRFKAAITDGETNKDNSIILFDYFTFHKVGFNCLANPQWRACGHWVVFTSLYLRNFLSSPLRPPAPALVRSNFTMLSVKAGGGVIKSSSINSDPWFGKGQCLSLGSLFSCCLLECSSSWQPLFLTMTLLCLTWIFVYSQKSTLIIRGPSTIYQEYVGCKVPLTNPMVGFSLRQNGFVSHSRPPRRCSIVN